VIGNLDFPYTVPYRAIYAVADGGVGGVESTNGTEGIDDPRRVEIIEFSRCYGGSAWARYHYAKSPLVLATKTIGDTVRYLCRVGEHDLALEASHAAAGIRRVAVDGKEIAITYVGLGGGGVGATTCRAGAGGVIRSEVSESGGGKVGSGTIVVPRRSRLIVGIDDTDSKEVGATWCLAHNIAEAVDCDYARYLSHSIVQLYPVPEKTQNCVSTALEFACLNGGAERVLAQIRDLLIEYSVSGETGMVALTGFDGSVLADYGRACKSGVLTREYALECAGDAGVNVWLDGNGVIGALGAIPYVAMPDESVVL